MLPGVQQRHMEFIFVIHCFNEESGDSVLVTFAPALREVRQDMKERNGRQGVVSPGIERIVAWCAVRFDCPSYSSQHFPRATTALQYTLALPVTWWNPGGRSVGRGDGKGRRELGEEHGRGKRSCESLGFRCRTRDDGSIGALPAQPALRAATPCPTPPSSLSLSLPPPLATARLLVRCALLGLAWHGVPLLSRTSGSREDVEPALSTLRVAWGGSRGRGGARSAGRVVGRGARGVIDMPVRSGIVLGPGTLSSTSTGAGSPPLHLLPPRPARGIWVTPGQEGQPGAWLGAAGRGGAPCAECCSTGTAVLQQPAPWQRRSQGRGGREQLPGHGALEQGRVGGVGAVQPGIEWKGGQNGREALPCGVSEMSSCQ